MRDESYSMRIENSKARRLEGQTRGLSHKVTEGCAETCLNTTEDKSMLLGTTECHANCVKSVDTSADAWFEIYTKCIDACDDKEVDKVG